VRALLREPGLRLQAIGGLLAQLTQTGGLAIVLVVQQTGGSFALAGAATAAFAIGAGVSRPVQGRLIDRRGARDVLVASAALHTVSLWGIVAVAKAGGVPWALVGLGALAGIGLPPVSQSMRVAWARALGADRDRTAAFSLITLVQEAAILLGPLTIGALIALASAPAALAVVAGASGLGTLVLAISISDRGRVGAVARRAGVLDSPGVRLVLALELLFGVGLGAIEVAIPALAVERGEPAASGALVAVLSVGGIGGAAAYGARGWQITAADRQPILFGACAVGLAPLALGPAALVAGALLLLTGIPLNPALTTMALMIDEHSPRTAAEAFGWASTAGAAGAALGSGLGGVLAQGGGASPAFALASGACLAAAVLALLARPRLRVAEVDPGLEPPPPPPAGNPRTAGSAGSR
jgi:predicted MFS family arabinose efflux permease